MTDEMKKKIGERIKAARKAKGLSQEALGEKLEVSFQAVSSWETGKFIPDAEHLPQLSAVLDLSLDSLFAEGDREWQLKPVNYNFSHMFTFVKGRAQMLNMPQTLAVLDILRSAHGAQERRSRYGCGCYLPAGRRRDHVYHYQKRDQCQPDRKQDARK